MPLHCSIISISRKLSLILAQSVGTLLNLLAKNHASLAKLCAGTENNLENGCISQRYFVITSMLAAVLENNILVLGLNFVNEVSGVNTGAASASEVYTTII